MLQIIAALPGEGIIPIGIAIRVNIILECLIDALGNRCIAVVVDFLHKCLNVLNTIRAKYRSGCCSTHLPQQADDNQKQQDDSTNQDHFSHSNQISQRMQDHVGYLFQNVPGIGSSLFDLSRNTAGEIIR